MKTREIKFRTWHIDYSIMEYSDKLFPPDNDYWDGVMATKLSMINSLLKSNDAIFMQYTGLKDKNGKEIYEGDILLGEHRNNKYRVFSVGGGFAVNTHQDDLNRDTPFYMGLSDMQNSSWVVNCKIIGNIHQNPELLTK